MAIDTKENATICSANHAEFGARELGRLYREAVCELDRANTEIGLTFGPQDGDKSQVNHEAAKRAVICLDAAMENLRVLRGTMAQNYATPGADNCAWCGKPLGDDKLMWTLGSGERVPMHSDCTIAEARSAHRSH